jgi:hemolysin activation/secretion protein
VNRVRGCALLFAWLWLVVGLGAGEHASAQSPPALKFVIERFVVSGENPLSASETDAILQPFTGEQDGLAGLQSAARALEVRMRAAGYTFHRVVVPPQRATAGAFQLEVLSFKLDRIEIQGNVNFSDENILASLPVLRSGVTPNARLMSRYVQAANEHPSKRLNVTVRQSRKPDHIDAVVEVRDIKPEQYFFSFNNRGSNQTGNFRAAVGYQHSNLFDRDHVFTGSLTTSPTKLRDVLQLGAFYQIPFYQLAGSLSLFVAYSDVDSGDVGNFLTVQGAGVFVGARYTHALQKVGPYTQKLVIGLEDKFFGNDINFQDTPIGVDVRSRPITLQYVGTLRRSWGTAGFHVGYSRNITTGSDNAPIDYANSRFGASDAWDLWRYGANLEYNLPDGWDFQAVFTGQHGGEPLISASR